MSEQAPERPTQARQAPAKGKKENVLTRKIGPLPTWAWVAIIAALLLLYVMWSGNKKAQASNAGGQKTGGFGEFLVPPTILHPHRGKGGGHGDNDGGHGDGGHHHHHKKHKHDEDDKIEDNPRWDRRSDRKHPDTKPSGGGGDTDTSTARDTRAVPGAPVGKVPGQLVQFTTAPTGPTPSLAQVASQYNTAPDAIVEEATGRGSPHGAMWRRYVAANDWQAPLPHGTDMTVLAQPQ